jgi:hypothetical protein
MWFVHLERMMIGNMVLPMCGVRGSNPCVALPDTGTSLLTLPSTRWRQVIDYIIKGRSDCTISEQNIVYCSKGAAGMPDLSFQFSGQIFTLTPADYLLYNYIVGIQSMDMGSNPGAQSSDLVVLGDPFLRAVYTVFDMDQARVGFANARAPQATTSTTASGSWGNAWTNWLGALMDTIWAWPPLMYFIGTTCVVLLAAYLCVGGWCDNGSDMDLSEHTPLYPPPPAVIAARQCSATSSPIAQTPSRNTGRPGHVAATYNYRTDADGYQYGGGHGHNNGNGKSHDYGSTVV